MSTRRQREQREKRKQEAARAWAEKEAVPSEFGIQSIRELDPEEFPEVCLHGRRSTRKQDVDSQVLGSRRLLEELGFIVKHYCRETGSGKKLGREDRPQLHKTFETAGRKGLPVVFPAFSRAVRDPGYDVWKCPDAKPDEALLEEFVEMTRSYGVPGVYTINDPDASPAQDESYLRELIATVQGKTVGRPRSKPRVYRREVKPECLEFARKLRAKGKSYREIGERVSRRFNISLSREAVFQWLKG